jgi:protein-S-isoprenylcysteine O-methyltransferase Ste14
MSLLRHWVAIVSVALFLPLLVYWPLVHGFIGFWRRLGIRISATIILGLLASLAVLVGWHGKALILSDMGSTMPTLITGVVLLIGATLLRRAIGKGMSMGVLAGFAEIRDERQPANLIRTGLHARIRHPRYLQLMVSQLGWALIANHQGPYLLLVVWMVAIHAIVRLEERELRSRFGEEYEDYCRKVPRFIPF